MSQADDRLRTAIGAPVAGRALFVDRDGTLFAARGYRIVRSADAGRSQTCESSSRVSPVAVSISLTLTLIFFTMHSFAVLRF